MDIFNHLAYNATGEEVDEAFSRCDYCRSNPHSCTYHVMLANVVDEKYIYAAWCTNKPKETEKE